jgi:hypothetical protein
MAGTWEAVKQQQIGRAGRSGLAIENLQAVHLGGAVLDGGHGISPWSFR